MHSLMWWCPLSGFPKKLLENQFVLESPLVGCWQSEWGIQSGSGWFALIWLQCSLTSQVTKLRLWPRPQPFQPKWALESGLSSSVSLPPHLSKTTTSQTPSIHCLWSRDNRRDDCLRNLWWCVCGRDWVRFYTAHAARMELNFLPSFILLIHMILRGSYHEIRIQYKLNKFWGIWASLITEVY